MGYTGVTVKGAMPIEFEGLWLYNLKEVSESVHLSVTTLKGYISSGVIKASKLGRERHFEESEVKRFLLEGTEPPKPTA